MKKRLFSLFLVCSMLASVFGMTVLADPPVDSGASLNQIVNIQLIHNGGGNYTVKFDTVTGFGAGSASFLVFDASIIDGENYTGVEDFDGWEDDVQGTVDVAGDIVGTKMSTGVQSMAVREDDNGTYAVNKFDFSLSPSNYQTSGTQYYLLLDTSKSVSAYKIFDIDTSGNVARSPMTAPTVTIATADETEGGVKATINQTADKDMVDHYVVKLYAAGADPATATPIATSVNITPNATGDTVWTLPINPQTRPDYKNGSNVIAMVTAVAKSSATKGDATSATPSAAANPAKRKFVKPTISSVAVATTSATLTTTSPVAPGSAGCYDIKYSLNGAAAATLAANKTITGLTAGQDYSVTITFEPNTKGGDYYIASDASDAKTFKTDNYAFTVDAASKTMTAVDFGTVPTAVTYTITNTGTKELTFDVASKANTNGFTAPLTTKTVAAGGTTTLTVNANAGLNAGTYAPVFTINGKNGSNTATPVDVTTNLTVNQKAVTIAVKANLAKTYGETKNLSLTDCDVTGLVAGTPLSNVTVTSTGSAATANASDTAYPVVINAPAASNPNYAITTTTTNGLKVNKARLNASVTATGIKTGQTVGTSTLTGTFTNTSNATMTLTQADGNLVWDTPTATMNATGPQNWTFTPTGANAGNYEPAAGTANIVVSEKTNPTITAADKTVPYDGSAKAIDTPTTNGGAVTVTYQDAANQPVAAPTNAGVYTAIITTAETADYAAGTDRKTLTITPREITLNDTGLTINNKVYDKTVAATLADGAALAIANKVGADDVAIDLAVAATKVEFATADAGTGKNVVVTITPSANALTGAAKGNYELKAATITKQANITARAITIEIRDITKQYGVEHTFNGQGWQIAETQPSGGGLVGNDSRDSLGFKLASVGAAADQNAGKYAVTWTKTNNNYNVTVSPADLSQKFTVTKVTPIEATAVTAGGVKQNAALSTSKLNGTFKHPVTNAPVAGTLAWTNGTKDMTTIGTSSEEWTFTPEDTTNYEPVTGNATVTVADKAGAGLTAQSKTVTYNGEAKAIDTPSATSNGRITITYLKDGQPVENNAPINAGTYDVEVVIDATEEYQGETANVELIIEPAEPTGNATASAVERGDTLNTSTLTPNFKDAEGNTIEGTAIWTPVIGQTPDIIQPDGNTEYTYTFTSNDGNYKKVAKVLVPVNSAEREPVVTKVINIPNTENPDYLYLSVANLKANDEVTFYSDAACENAISEAITIDAADKAAGTDKKVVLNADALAQTAGTIYAKLAVSATGKAVAYPAEVGFNVATVSVRVGQTANVVAVPADASYTMQDTTWTIASEDEAIATVAKSETANDRAVVTGVAAGAVNMTVTATFEHPDELVGGTIDVEKTVPVTVRKKSSGGGGGGAATPSSYTVRYMVGDYGKLTSGNASETVKKDESPKAVPEVEANEGYTFKGWSLDGKTVVDPAEQKITAATTFTALYEKVDDNTPVDTQTHKAYVYGYAEDGTFRPERGITRAEAAAIFARALTDFTEGTKSANTMKDIAGDEWYADYVNYLVSKNVITGYEDGTFRPTQSITRREFTAMISRLVEVLPEEELNFSDVNADDWSRQYISTALQNGWISGYEDGTFRPGNSITRAEVVRVVNAYLQRGVDGAGLANADYTRFPDVAASHWAYYDIIEAANDHTYTIGTKPEVWVK